jgi:hypothetical protein
LEFDFIFGGDGVGAGSGEKLPYAAAVAELDDGMTLGRFFFAEGCFFLLLETLLAPLELIDELDKLRCGRSTLSMASVRYRSELLRALRDSSSDTTPLRFSESSRIESHVGELSPSCASGFLARTQRVCPLGATAK